MRLKRGFLKNIYSLLWLLRFTSVFSITQAEQGSSAAITELSPSAVSTKSSKLEMEANETLALTFSPSIPWYREEGKQWCGVSAGGRGSEQAATAPPRRSPTGAYNWTPAKTGECHCSVLSEGDHSSLLPSQRRYIAYSPLCITRVFDIPFAFKCEENKPFCPSL